MEKEKVIKFLERTETTYDNDTYWITYSIDDKVSYEIQENNERGFPGKVPLLDKNDINICSDELRKLIEDCRLSESEMWFIEEEDKYLPEEEFEALMQEVDDLNLNGYIKFNEDGCKVTVYGGVITCFKF